MKKILLCFLFTVFSCGVVFSQNAKNWNWGGIIRLNPLTTILELALAGTFGITADWVPYVTPNIGIPIEIDISTINGLYGIMAGIEAIPLRHKEKSGLYLSAMGGPYYHANNRVFFGLKANTGYQLVTARGFAITSAIGIKYIGRTGTVNDLTFDLTAGIGFAYKKRQIELQKP